MKAVRSLRSPLFKILVVLVLAWPAALLAQSNPQPSPTVPSEPAPSLEASRPTTEAVQTRIERARALVAAHQLETAASELESVRASAQDSSVRNISSIMLMNIYLEAGNYGRAEAILEENFRSRSAQVGGSYFALAGQAVNGARTHLARYRALGINTSAADLPAEAVSDLDRLRSLLERMIVQAKEIADERKAYDSLSLLEDVLGIRLSMARDSEEQTRWSNEYSGAREMLASQTQFASPGAASKSPPVKTAIKTQSPYSIRRAPEAKDVKAAEESNHSVSQPASSPPVTDTTKPADAELSDFGLLNLKASKRVMPRYPPLARQTGTSGLVRVHVMVDETGKVVNVSRTEGPLLLRQVSEDAARQWFFEGIRVPDQKTPSSRRFTGYIEFKFTF